jgi:hypothetical protein
VHIRELVIDACQSSMVLNWRGDGRDERRDPCSQSQCANGPRIGNGRGRNGKQRVLLDRNQRIDCRVSRTVSYSYGQEEKDFIASVVQRQAHGSTERKPGLCSSSAKRGSPRALLFEVFCVEKVLRKKVESAPAIFTASRSRVRMFDAAARGSPVFRQKTD